MHDLRVLREQIDLLRDGMRRRCMFDTVGPAIDRGQALDVERRALISATDDRKAQRNSNAQEVAKRKRAGENADELIAHGRSLGDEIAKYERDLAAIEEALRRMLLEIPNVTLPDVPSGGEENNTIEREWGTPRSPDWNKLMSNSTARAPISFSCWSIPDHSGSKMRDRVTRLMSPGTS